MKTVIHVWTQHAITYKRLDPSWVRNYGLGDLIRGTIGLFRLFKKNDYKFIVDVSLHPISKFLKVQRHEYSNLVKSNKNTIYAIHYTDIDTYINLQLSTTNVAFLNTQCWVDEYDIPPTE